MSDQKRPNILFLFTDDQRYDTIHALGNEAIHTPNMDRLVASGSTFTHAHVMGSMSGAVCMPSRAMLMTGRTLFHLQGPGLGQRIPEDHTLLGEALQAEGYNCFGTGKWHNSPPAYMRSFNAGAEIFFGGMDDHWNVPAYNYDPTGEYATRLPRVVDFRTQKVAYKRGDHIHAGKHSSELFADATIDYLQRYAEDTPFFMYIAFMAPHDPRTMPKRYLDMYPAEEIELPPNYMPEHPFDNGELRIRDEVLAGFPRTEQEVREHTAAYYAMITHLDAQIGRILEALEASGEADNTIIVFAGDNGLAVGRHGLFGKQNLYEHSSRVPLIFSGPDIPRGERSDALCYLLDIYPTLCDLTGIDTPDSVDGASLAPIITGDAASVRDTLFCAYKVQQRAVRDNRYKLIEYNIDGVRHTQLFDTIEDPWELNNLAEDPAYVNTLTSLREELAEWQKRTDDPIA